MPEQVRHSGEQGRQRASTRVVERGQMEVQVPGTIRYSPGEQAVHTRVPVALVHARQPEGHCRHSPGCQYHPTAQPPHSPTCNPQPCPHCRHSPLAPHRLQPDPQLLHSPQPPTTTPQVPSGHIPIQTSSYLQSVHCTYSLQYVPTSTQPTLHPVQLYCDASQQSLHAAWHLQQAESLLPRQYPVPHTQVLLTNTVICSGLQAVQYPGPDTHSPQPAPQARQLPLPSSQYPAAQMQVLTARTRVLKQEVQVVGAEVQARQGGEQGRQVRLESQQYPVMHRQVELMRMRCWGAGHGMQQQGGGSSSTSRQGSSSEGRRGASSGGIWADAGYISIGVSRVVISLPQPPNKYPWGRLYPRPQIIQHPMQKYDILDMIDEGAYGIVWKATHKQTGQMVAIKQFKEGDDDELARRSIQKQIRMLRMLKGEYIVNIKEAFRKKNKVFLIFEYFPRNLLNFIEVSNHGLEPGLINRIVYKIIRCLRFLHQKNILHRDIKPENILLDESAQVLKLCDFGFARFLPEASEELTQYVATRWYRSPELLVGDRYGKPADVWALGCMVGELVDGDPMFPGENELNQLQLIRGTLGELPQRLIGLMKRNEKFNGAELEPVKRTDPLQARYIGKIEKKALSFLKACLVLDPAQRITIQQALRHPYIIDLSTADNELTDETNLLYSNRALTQRNSYGSFGQQIIINNDNQKLYEASPSLDKSQKRISKSKVVEVQPQQPSLKIQSGSMPQTEIYKLLREKKTSKPNLEKLQKKYSHANLKAADNETMKSKFKGTNPSNSPKIKFKKQPTGKMFKVMSEQKKFNYNIDVKLSINLKINDKLKQSAFNALPIPQETKLPEIKNNNNKMLKYRLNTKYSNLGLNTIYNSYGNLSILGESKQISKGTTKKG